MDSQRTKSPNNVFSIIDSYKTKNLYEIRKIQVKWAFGVNKKHKLYRPNGIKVFYVDLKKLIAIANFGEMDHEKLDPQRLFVGLSARDFRIARALYHWDENGFIDPPEINIDNSQKISFVDGRHRTIAAFHLGENQIPVFVHKSAIKNISAHIELIKPKEDI